MDPRKKKDVVEPIIASVAEEKRKTVHTKRPIPAEAYPVIDTDLGRDNVENDIPAADLEDLQ